jgi:phosphoribosylanthranilate isomerase
VDLGALKQVVRSEIDTRRPAMDVVGQRTRVKICGITREQDARAACAWGADAVGLVFYGPSPRAVDVDQAIFIRRAVTPFVTVVGLFVNADGEEVAEIARRVPLDLLQFHGNESPEVCAGFGLPYVKAVRVAEGVDLQREAERYHDASALLLDTLDGRLWGGSGRTFDWALVPEAMGKPVVLAGGLTPDNVGEAVVRLRPYAVDVSGGVESAPGIKDADKIAKFIREVDRATIAERTG